MQPQLSKMFIGVIFGVVLFLSMFYFLSDGIAAYNPVNVPANYNQTAVRFQNSLNDINQTIAGVQGELSDINAQSGVTDFLGFFFSAGYKAIIGAGQISTTTASFIDDSVDVILPGRIGPLLKTGLYLSLLVIIFIGIILHAITKSDRN